jgi:transcriptional regulator with XRE-family HTH domain
MSTAFAEEAVRVRRRGRLSDRLIADATGAAPSTVRSWLSRRSEPTGARADRIAELSAIVDRLAKVVRPEYIPVWMTKPLEALDDERPIDLIRRGEYRRVAALIGELEDPGAA